MHPNRGQGPSDLWGDNNNKDEINSRHKTFSRPRTPLCEPRGQACISRDGLAQCRECIRAHGGAGFATPGHFAQSAEVMPQFGPQRSTGHKLKTVSGEAPDSCPVQDPASTSLGFCPAEAQPPRRTETLHTECRSVMGLHDPPGKVHLQCWADVPASPSPGVPFRASPETQLQREQKCLDATPQLRSLWSLALHGQEPPGDPDTALWGSLSHPGRAPAGPGAVTRC